MLETVSLEQDNDIDIRITKRDSEFLNNSESLFYSFIYKHLFGYTMIYSSVTAFSTTSP
jgi:hypothetical protein